MHHTLTEPTTYDGLGRRVTETTLSSTNDLYYSASWQVVHCLADTIKWRI